MSQAPLRGLWAALASPLDADGALDHGRLAAHGRSLLEGGCDGLAPFGTTGEGFSFSVAERQAGLEALLACGVPAARLMASVGAASVSDALALGRHALQAGVERLLYLPPFYFKEVSDEGIHAAVAGLLERLREPRARLVLYHIPQVSQVGFSAALIARLSADFPGCVAGIKDSTGNLDHTLDLARRFPGLAVFCGTEEHLPALLAAGGAGSICGLANVVPQLMRRLYDAAGTAAADALCERLARLVACVAEGAFVPCLKALLAATRGDAGWSRVRAPLAELPAAEKAALLACARASGALAATAPRESP